MKLLIQHAAMRGWRKLLHAFQSRGGERGERGGGEWEGEGVARERVWD
jgi:hypothetical protein